MSHLTFRVCDSKIRDLSVQLDFENSTPGSMSALTLSIKKTTMSAILRKGTWGEL